jgi:hypothetical protein
MRGGRRKAGGQKQRSRDRKDRCDAHDGPPSG